LARVLLVFEPPDGGVAEQVKQLALNLGSAGFEVELAGPEESIIYPELEAAGVRFARLPFVRGYGAPGTDSAALRRLIGLLRARRPALAHCHSAKAGVLGRLAGRVTSTPVVYSPHSFPFVGDFSETRRRFALAVEMALAPLTAATVCVCEFERRVAIEQRVGSPARLRVIYNGCPPCPAAEADPGLLSLREGGLVAAALTVLREQKSVDVLIDAAPRVLAECPKARVAIVGDGPLREQLEARARRLGLDRETRFAFLPFRAPAARYLAAMDLYVLSSAWEAFPIGVLEAQACGVAQVATDVGGTAEAVDSSTGRLVPARDPAALAGAMCELLGDGALRDSLAGASRRRHSERFTVERMVAETSDLYRELLSGRFPW
jgi:glycosyltransferase involved in cell wall biosynthesis